MVPRKGPVANQNIRAALQRVEREIDLQTDRTDKFSRGLSVEGYSGGYLQALRDVMLVLNGVQPNTRDYWDDWKSPPAQSGGKQVS